MPIRINNIILDIDEPMKALQEKAAKKLRLPVKELKDLRIVKESIDARRKNNIRFNYSVLLRFENEKKLLSRVKDDDIIYEEEEIAEPIKYGTKIMEHRPIIVGMGPAGMFAGLLMAKNGYRPLIIERGKKVEDRTVQVEKFWESGSLDVNTNVQFGEGGAGTFSDGKLTTRIKDKRCSFVLEEFVKSGAPEEILYMGKPHIGTDILKSVVKNIRERIIELGGEIKFESRLEDINFKNDEIESVVVNGTEIPCSALILALGHSSRDTYEMLLKRGIFMEPKPFAIGVRAEHKQSMIDEIQYGKYAGHPRLRAADYRLAYSSKKLNRSIYSFCMCPGGEVVAAASEEKRLVTNGMSLYKRDKENANAALVVSVSPQDFEGSDPLSGMEFQRHYEELAYRTGGGNYKAPVQLIGDFLKDEKSTKIGDIKPTYRPGYEFAMLSGCLPPYVIDGLKEGILEFDKKIKGYASPDGVLTGIETRTSAPVRIVRNENLQSISKKGLYPAGEGAGYAGGIISAAVDGLKVSEAVMKDWAPLS